MYARALIIHCIHTRGRTHKLVKIRISAPHSFFQRLHSFSFGANNSSFPVSHFQTTIKPALASPLQKSRNMSTKKSKSKAAKTYEVEKIVKKRVVDNKTQYFIKWVGFDA